MYHDEEVIPQLSTAGRQLGKYVTVLANKSFGGINPDNPGRWVVSLSIGAADHLALVLYELSWQQWGVQLKLVADGESVALKAWLFAPYVSDPDIGPSAYCPKCLSRDCDMETCTELVEVEVIELSGSHDVFKKAVRTQLSPATSQRGQPSRPTSAPHAFDPDGETFGHTL